MHPPSLPLRGCRLLAALLPFLLPLAAPAADSDPVLDAFQSPPDEAKPWVFFWWFNGWVDKPGITHHLEELKDKGVGGMVLYQSPSGTVPPGAKFLSPEWRELFLYTEQECARLGLKLALNVCDSWPSGGPWVPVESSSWSHTASILPLAGLQAFEGKLPEPPDFGPHYRDVAVWAYPDTAPEGAGNNNIPKLTASSNPDALPRLAGPPDYSTFWFSAQRPTPLSAAAPEWVQLEYPNPKRVDYVWIGGNAFRAPTATDVQASDDGVAFHSIGKLSATYLNPSVGPVTPTTARFFRFIFNGGGIANWVIVHTLQIGTRAEVERTALLAAKACRSTLDGPTSTSMAAQTSFPWQPLAPAPGDAPLPLKDAVDLTARTAPDGTLKWDVPPGRWKVVRVGANATAIPAGGGYLTDYLSAAAMDLQAAAFAQTVKEAGPLAGKTFVRFHEDNPEIGGLFSWTPKFLDEFQRRRGYDPRPYLPALGGQIVEDTGVTDRFLHDYRRTVADCVAENHYGEWAKQAHAAGIGVQAEAGGQYLPQMHPVDGLMNLGLMEVPVAEFWLSAHWKENQAMEPHVWVQSGAPPLPAWSESAQNANTKQAASAGHIYGKPVVAAEAFTTLGPLSHWAVGPGDLLLYANIAFCEGINRFTLHSSTANKSTDGFPGYEYAAGNHINPKVTWWPFSGPFFSFLGRCDALLQRGLFVADVLYYSGDDIPNYVPPKHVDPSLGPGYDYDVCNTEVLLGRLAVKDGRIVLPDGMSYRVLVLPPAQVLPLAAAQKVADLVRAGAAVIGPKPLRTPGLKDYAAEEAALARITAEVWGPCDGATVTDHSYGSGHVYWGRPIREVLASLATPPDFASTSPDPQALLDFIHRRDGGTDLYFVANRRAQAGAYAATFRVAGRQPEIWDPFTGQVRDAAAFTQQDGLTTVPLALDRYGSCFVVFRKKIAEGQSGQGDGNFPRFTPAGTVDGPWEVKFDPAWGGPASVAFDKLEDWTARPEEGIRHYSGTATYVNQFEAPMGAAGHRLFLDLGQVQNVARVRVNGHEAGIAWHEPYRVEIGPWLAPGTNRLEVEVANLWRNRLIGDAALPEAQRVTKSNIVLSKDLPLSPSGLIGPVALETSDAETPAP